MKSFKKMFPLLATLAVLCLSGCDTLFNTSPTPSVEETLIPTQAPSTTPEPLDVVFAPQLSDPAYENSLNKYYVLNVAMLVPLSGAQESMGLSLQRAAQMALFDRKTRDVNLRFYNTATGATAAAKRALEEGAHLIIGPLNAKDVQDIKPLTQGRVNVISFTTDKTAVSDGLFSLGFLPDQIIQRVVRYAYNQGKRDLAVFVPETPYGQLVYDNAALVMKSFGDKVPLKFTYTDATPEGINQAVARMVPQLGQTTAILIPEGNPRLKDIIEVVNFNLSKQLEFNGINPLTVKYLGSGLWNDPSVHTLQMLDRSWYAAPMLNGQRLFHERFQQKYGFMPAPLASLGYDALSLAAYVASKTHGDHGYDAIHKMLMNPAGFYGIDGLFRFMPNGYADHALDVIEITTFGVNTIDPAPRAF